MSLRRTHHTLDISIFFSDVLMLCAVCVCELLFSSWSDPSAVAWNHRESLTLFNSSGATRLQWCVSSVDGSAGFRQWTDDHSGHFWIQISSDLTLTYVHMHLNLNLKGLKRLNLFKGAFRSRFLWVQQRQQLKRQLKVAEPPVMFA